VEFYRPRLGIWPQNLDSNASNSCVMPSMMTRVFWALQQGLSATHPADQICVFICEKVHPHIIEPTHVPIPWKPSTVHTSTCRVRHRAIQRFCGSLHPISHCVYVACCMLHVLLRAQTMLLHTHTVHTHHTNNPETPRGVGLNQVELSTMPHNLAYRVYTLGQTASKNLQRRLPARRGNLDLSKLSHFDLLWARCVDVCACVGMRVIRAKPYRSHRLARVHW
jgi:hypothetical protein